MTKRVHSFSGVVSLCNIVYLGKQLLARLGFAKCKNSDSAELNARGKSLTVSNRHNLLKENNCCMAFHTAQILWVTCVFITAYIPRLFCVWDYVVYPWITARLCQSSEVDKIEWWSTLSCKTQHLIRQLHCTGEDVIQ